MNFGAYLLLTEIFRYLGQNKSDYFTLCGNNFVPKIVNNRTVMIVRKIMADLLSYTKKVAESIKYYDALIDFTDDTHWLNPFYRQPEVTVIWTENTDNEIDF